SGFLEPDEWPDRLREAAPRVDANRDGRIDRDEYRAYFEGRVIATLQRGPEPQSLVRAPTGGPVTAPVQPPMVAIRAGHLPPGLPPWFTELDLDHDGQITLWEWRRSGRPVAEF